MNLLRSNQFLRLSLILGLVFVAALLWRRHDLDGSGFWMDEIFQSNCTTRPVSEIWSKSPANKPPLDYYIQALFIGDTTDEYRARLHAAIIGAGTVALFGAWGLMLGGWGLASILVALTFSLPLLIRYSQEGRPYALFIFAETLFFAVLWRLILGPKPVRWRWWAALAGAFVLSMWSHYAALTACVTGLAFLAAWIPFSAKARAAAWKELGNYRTVLVLIGLALVAAACWIPLQGRVAVAAQETGFAAYDAKGWRGMALPYLDIYALGYEWYQYKHGGHAILIALMLIGWADWTRRRGDKALFVNFCMFVFLANFAGMFVVYHKLDHWMELRYTLGALPPAIMLAAVGIGSVVDAAVFGVRKFAGPAGGDLEKIRAIAVAFACVAIVSGYCAYVDHSPFRKTDYRGVARMIRDSKAPADLKIVGAAWEDYVAMTHYMKRWGLKYEVVNGASAPKIVEACLMYYPNVIYVRSALGLNRKDYVQKLDEMPLRPYRRPYTYMDVRHSPNEVDVLARANLAQEPCPMLLAGWGAPQPVGPELVRPIVGAKSSLVFDCPAPRDLMVVTGAKPVAHDGRRPIALKLSVNGSELATSRTLGREWTLACWTVGKSKLRAGKNVIELTVSQAPGASAPDPPKPTVLVRSVDIFKWDKVSPKPARQSR